METTLIVKELEICLFVNIYIRALEFINTETCNTNGITSPCTDFKQLTQVTWRNFYKNNVQPSKHIYNLTPWLSVVFSVDMIPAGNDLNKSTTDKWQPQS